MVNYLSRYVMERNFDGIAFLTYAENFSQRYEDEFGYNQPIVDEFRKRYGVDIRTEPFDKLAWAKLRGEYLTQFMRERDFVCALGGGQNGDHDADDGDGHDHADRHHHAQTRAVPIRVLPVVCGDWISSCVCPFAIGV